jgi:hypothetical protein
MKKLLIYKENGEFVIERVNEFNYTFKQNFINEQGLLEGLQSYQGVIDKYKLEVSDELWSLVINFLGSSELK